MSEDQTNDRGMPEDAQPEWSQFSRRLASFGLGETPDPLLTRVTPPSAKPKPRRGDRGHGRGGASRQRP